MPRGPLKNSFSSAIADEALKCRDARLIVGQHIRGGGVAVEPARILLGDPDLDQVTADAVALGEGVGRLSAQNSWTTCRLNSIECVRCLAMGFLLESPVQLADFRCPTCPPQGVHSRSSQNCKNMAAIKAQNQLPKASNRAA